MSSVESSDSNSVLFINRLWDLFIPLHKAGWSTEENQITIQAEIISFQLEQSYHSVVQAFNEVLYMGCC